MATLLWQHEVCDRCDVVATSLGEADEAEVRARLRFARRSRGAYLNFPLSKPRALAMSCRPSPTQNKCYSQRISKEEIQGDSLACAPCQAKLAARQAASTDVCLSLLRTYLHMLHVFPCGRKVASEILIPRGPNNSPMLLFPVSENFLRAKLHNNRIAGLLVLPACTGGLGVNTIVLVRVSSFLVVVVAKGGKEAYLRNYSKFLPHMAAEYSGLGPC